MKEAYRLNKSQVQSDHLVLAFVYTSNDMPDFKFIQKRFLKSLDRLNKELA